MSVLRNNEVLINLRIEVSIRYLTLTAVLHVLAFVALLFTSLNACLLVFFSVVIFIHAAAYLKKYVFLKSSQSIQALRIKDDQWYIKVRSGWKRVWIKGEVLVTPWLICAQFKEDGSRAVYALNVFSDSGRVEDVHGVRLKLLLSTLGSRDRKPGEA